jgi:hypothetical protein
MSPEEIRRRMDELNAKAATRPGAVPVNQQLAAQGEAMTKQRRLESLIRADYERQGSAAATAIAAIDQRLNAVRTQGHTLEQYRDGLAREGNAEVAAASAAGTRSFSGVVGHSVFAGTSTDPYAAQQAMQAAKEKYGQKIDEVDDRLRQLVAEQDQLVNSRKAIRQKIIARMPIDKAALSSERQVHALTIEGVTGPATPPDLDDLAKQYPGVDLRAIWADAVAKCADSTGVDITAAPAESIVGSAIINGAMTQFQMSLYKLKTATIQPAPVAAEPQR